MWHDSTHRHNGEKIAAGRGVGEGGRAEGGRLRWRADFLQIAVQPSSAGVQQLKVIMINSILADSGDRDTSGPACWADPVLLDTSLQSHVLKL